MPENKPPFKRYIPFTSDYGFKVTFGNEHNTLFLRRALQALIRSPDPILEVVFEKNTKEGITERSRNSVYDVTCRHDNGELSIVEMQLLVFPNFIKRMEYYAFLRMNPYIKKGDWAFDNIPRMYTIGILGFNLYPDDRYYRWATIRDENGLELDPDFIFILVELEKFEKSAELCITDLDKLIFTMKEAHSLSESGKSPAFMQEDWIKSAIAELDSGRLEPEERSLLEMEIAREMARRNGPKLWAKHVAAQAIKEGFQQGHEAGLQAGLQEGRQVGLQEGRQAGLQEGRQEGIEEGAEARLLKDIRRMIQVLGLTDLQIAEVLEIPLEKVVSVRKELSA